MGEVSFDVISSILMKLGVQDPGIHEYMGRYFDKDHNGRYDYFEF